MELVDIGVNLGHRSFGEDREAVIARAVAAGVSQMIVTGTSGIELTPCSRMFPASVRVQPIIWIALIPQPLCWMSRWSE